MTPNELLTAVTPLLDVRTFEPFVLVGTNGGVVHIDHPSELEPGIAWRVKRRRQEANGMSIDPRDVAAVERLDRFGGGEGHRYSKFRDTLRSLLRADPFAPFEIELRSAAKLRVDSPNRLAVSGRFALLVSSGQPLVTFSDADVVRITPSEVSANAG